jgi:hypothetical protein
LRTRTAEAATASGGRPIDKKATIEARARQLRGEAQLQVAFGYPTPSVVRPERRHLAGIGARAFSGGGSHPLSLRAGTPADRDQAEARRHRARKASRAARRRNR